MNKEKLVKLVTRTIEVYTKHEMGVYSGYTTFYLLISFVPLMMMVVSVINILPWFSADDFIYLFMRLLPDIPQVRYMVSSVIYTIEHQTGRLVVYLFAFTSLWSGSHGISSIMAGLEKINHTQRAYLFDKVKSIIYAVLFCILIPSLLLFEMLRTILEQGIINLFEILSLPEVGLRINQLMKFSGIVTILAMILIILMTYTYLPFGKRKIRNQLPGAVFSSVLWIVFTKGFGFCIKKFWRMSSVYGTFASISLVAMWLKFIITILFYGASLNRALQVKVSRDCST